jgi:hypothetical protein
VRTVGSTRIVDAWVKEIGLDPAAAAKGAMPPDADIGTPDKQS